MYKNTVALVLQLLLFVPRLSENERSVTIGMFKASVHVSVVTRYYNCHQSAVQQLRDCYQATRTVKGRHMPGQLRMAADIETATYVDYIVDIYIDNIDSVWQPTLPDD